MKNTEIEFGAFVRCTPRKSYYQGIADGLKCKRFVVSEFPPHSPRNRFSKSEKFKKVSYEEAANYKGLVFFKNASFYGSSNFYILIDSDK